MRFNGILPSFGCEGNWICIGIHSTAFVHTELAGGCGVQIEIVYGRASTFWTRHLFRSQSERGRGAGLYRDRDISYHVIQTVTESRPGHDLVFSVRLV